MADAAAPVTIPDPQLYAGPALVGVLLMYCFFGLVLAETLTFVGNATSRSRWYLNPALLVGAVVLLSFGSLCNITSLVWQRLVIDTAVPAHMWIPPRQSLATSPINGIVAFLVQAFFVRKVWVLGSALKKPLLKIPGIVIGVLALAHLSSGFAVGIVFGRSNRTYPRTMKIVIGYNLITALAADIAITASMIALLSHYKRQSSFSSTKSLLNTITRHTIENAALPTAAALANVIVVYTRTDNVHMIFQYNMCQLYALVLVISLNRSRKVSNSASQDTSQALNSTSGPGIPLSQRHVDLRKMDASRSQAPMQVSVVQHVDVEHDSDDGRRTEWDRSEKSSMHKTPV